MKTPGVTVRPIDSMGGPAEINEVFFDNVEVPYDCLIGPIHEGWSVVVNALANERLGFVMRVREIIGAERFQQLKTSYKKWR